MSRETIRSAISRLEDEGLIDRIKHRGCVIKEGKLSDQPNSQEGLISKSVLMAVLDEGQEELAPESSSGQTSRGCLRAIRKLGLHAVLLSTDRISGGALESLAASQPYGLVVAESQAKKLALSQVSGQFSKVGVRMVQVGGNPDEPAMSLVTSNHARGGTLAAQALVDRGCRRLIWVGSVDPTSYWAAARRRSAAEVCAASGLSGLRTVRVLGFSGRAGDAETFDSIARAFAGHLVDCLGVNSQVGESAGLPGLLAANDIEAALTIRACRHLGWTPGVDVLVAGYDNQHEHLPEKNWEPQPPCVTIDKRNVELGTAAVELLGDAALSRSPCTRTLDPHLVSLD